MRERFWSLIGLYLIPMITVVAGLVVVAIQYVNPPWFKLEYTLATILGLLILTVTSELVERARLIARIDTRIEEGFRDVLAAINANDQEILVGVDQIYQFWSNHVGKLTRSFDSISLNPPFPATSSVPVFRQKATRAVSKNRIRRRYIVVFHHLSTLERVERDLQAYPHGTYYVGYFEPGEIPFPMITFAIGDNEMVTYGGYYRPHESPGIAVNILSRHPDTVDLFSEYFESLWKRATMLNPDYVRHDLIEAIRARLESESGV